MLSRSLPAKLSASYLHGFLSVQHAVSLPPTEAFRKLFAWFPVRPACSLAPSHWSFPQALCTVSCPSSMLSRSLPAKLSPRYLHRFLSVQHALSLPPSEAFRKLFARFPLRPACCLAPSQRSFPQAICTVSSPSSMLSRSFPAKLSASYLHGFLSVHHALSLPPSEAFGRLFARFPLRPACCLAPSQQSFPQAISTVSSPSSMLSRSFPAKLSASYLHSFLSVQHAVSPPPGEAFRKLFPRFPLRPACCLAPSQRNSPQAISTFSCPSSMLSRSLPAKLSASYFHGFLSVQHAVSLLPSEAFRKLFARFPLRPACCLAPSRRSFPQAISTVSCPSSMLSRSLPAKLSASYFHVFLSVQHAVSLPPREAFRKLFPRFPPVQHAVSLPSQRSFPQAICTLSFRPACCLAPSQRSSPQAICTVSSPSSIPSLPPSLPSSLPPFLPSFLPSFLLSFLPISDPSPSNTPSRSLATKCLNENPSIGDAFGKKHESLQTSLCFSPWFTIVITITHLTSHGNSLAAPRPSAAAKDDLLSVLGIDGSCTQVTVEERWVAVGYWMLLMLAIINHNDNHHHHLRHLHHHHHHHHHPIIILMIVHNSYILA